MTFTTTLSLADSPTVGLPQTPYRALSTIEHATTPRTLIPAWADKRTVYRAGHATYYVVDTDNLSQARADLRSLEGLGWTVEIHPLSLNGAARITMNMTEVPQAA